MNLLSPLDPKSASAQNLLRGIQGNILKGHGRNSAAYLILRFGHDRGAARHWISQFASTRLTTAHQQEVAAQAYSTAGVDGGTFASLLLSAAGYQALGLAAQIPADADDLFVPGMKKIGVAPTLKDPPVSQWEPPYQEAIHSVIVLADDCAERLHGMVQELSSQLASFASVLTSEWGKRLCHDGKDIEHFGYTDGVSQPLFLTDQIAREVALRGNQFWDPSAPLGLVLTEERHRRNTYGSFVVFRKLEQNVRRFRQLEEALADRLGLRGDARRLAGALAVGRFKDGSPLVPASLPSQVGEPANDFTYEVDPHGQFCPFHAHIRKNNPRSDLQRRNPTDGPPQPLSTERSFRIARRGIPYGDRPDLTDLSCPPPAAGVGLLFTSYQFRLRNFEIQQAGDDDSGFLTRTTGIDPIVGQGEGRILQRWPSRWPIGSPEEVVLFDMRDVVSLKGGEYLFAPSKPFLVDLGAG